MKEENPQQKKEFNLSPELENQISTFFKQVESGDLKSYTKPSPILTGGIEEINLTKLEPQDIEKYLWMHPIVPRGIELMANRMISRGYSIKPGGNSSKAKDAVESMKAILRNSGGLIGIKKWIEDAKGFGTGFKTLVPNKKGTKILKLLPEHPVYFRINKYSKNYKNKELRGKYKIDTNTKEPIEYSQYKYDRLQSKWVPIGEPIKANYVAPLVFDTWGDEHQGISIVQYLHLTLKYLMNIEEAGAETMYRNGFVQKKVMTDITNENDLKLMGKNLTQINRRDAIILPKGTDVQNLNPGQTEFPEYHKVFVRLVATRLGIPQPLLTQDATTTNKATIQEQKEDMFDDLRADEIIVKQTIENKVFVPACIMEFGKDFTEFPTFEFNGTPEDEDSKTEIMVKKSMAVNQLVNSAKELRDMERMDEFSLIMNQISEFLGKKETEEGLETDKNGTK